VYRGGQQDFTSRDPLLIARRNLIASGLPAEQLDSIEQAAVAEFMELLAAVREDSPPAAGDALLHVFADAGQAA
jgi:TPP-dependent pyruvate/acetoin dehydrogenase alpha subunit